MNEGRKILLKIIEDRLLKSSNISDPSIEYYGISLLDLSESLNESILNLIDVDEALINKVIPAEKKYDNLRKKIVQLRDLLIGQRDYNLQVTLTREYEKAYSDFKKLVENSITEEMQNVRTNKEEMAKLKVLQKNIDSYEIISDFSFIEQIVREYNSIEFDNNMLDIMTFINNHNLSILRVSNKKPVEFTIQTIKRPHLDERILAIFNRLNIDAKDVPNYILSDFKRGDIDRIYTTFQLVKKNKAEDYGILHLIKKENILAKLSLVLYASENSIREVVDILRDPNGTVDIKLLKIILNNIVSVFFDIENEYYLSKHDTFMKNMVTIRDLGVNYRALITKNPLFMLIDNNVLEYTLNYLSLNGADKKRIINKCYKTLSYNPALLIENVEIMKKYALDLQSFFQDVNANYNIIKCTNLDQVLNGMKKAGILTRGDDFELINKVMISNIYHHTRQTRNTGSDNDA